MKLRKHHLYVDLTNRAKVAVHKKLEEVQKKGIYKNTWAGVAPGTIKKYALDNKLTIKKGADSGIKYGFKGTEVVFKYDPEDLNLYTDYTLIDFMNKKLA